MPIGAIPTLGCCRPVGCRSWVQVEWFTYFGPGAPGGGDENAAAARMAQFEAGLDMVNLFPFTSNPRPPNWAQRAGIQGSLRFALNGEPPLFALASVALSVSGPCGSCMRATLPLTGDPDVALGVMFARKIRVFVPAAYCTVSREYTFAWGAVLRIVPGTLNRQAFSSAPNVYVDIAMPAGSFAVNWFDEFCDKAPDGGPDP